MASLDPLFLRPLLNLLSGCRKLAATCRGNLPWQGHIGTHYVIPRLGVCKLCRPRWIWGVAERLNFGFVTPRVAVAAEVDKALLSYGFEVQVRGAPDITVTGCVNVPGLRKAATVRVHENGYVRECVVVIDDVCEVGHGFVTLVNRSVKRPSGIVVDAVDGGFESAEDKRSAQA